MISIIVLTSLAVILFILLVVSIITTVVHKKKSSSFLAAMSISFLVVILADAVAIGYYIYNNHDTILSTVLEKTSDITSDGLALTASNFEENWDKELIKNFGNVFISVRSVEFQLEDNEKIYTIEVIIDNRNEPKRKMYLHDLMNNNYLVACDTDDIVYAMETVKYENDKIPVGKTIAKYKVAVDKDVTLSYLRFIAEKISLEKQEQ